MSQLPHMIFKGQDPIKVFQVNDSILMAIYRGKLSKFDILIKYRQKLKNDKWSLIRTPKHIHWTVDILIKMQVHQQLTREFLDFFIDIWEKTKPLTSEKEQHSIDLESLLKMSNSEIKQFNELSKVGEYSVRFLILLAKLLMLQEKTNRHDAYMFKRVLDGLKEGEDLFRVLATATLQKRS